MKTSYTADVNSTNNQNVKGQFVGREVYANVGTMVEYILNKSYEDSDAPFSHDDVENMTSPETVDENQFRYIVNLNERGEFSADFYRIDEDGDDESESCFHIDTEAAQELANEYGIDPENGEAVAEHYFDMQKEFCGCKRWGYFTILDESDEVNKTDGEEQEVYEWWAVSSFLFDKLKEAGEPVLDAGSTYVWGRTGSGQAILLDSVITTICLGMGILEGQPNDWSKK